MINSPSNHHANISLFDLFFCPGLNIPALLRCTGAVLIACCLLLHCGKEFAIAFFFGYLAMSSLLKVDSVTIEWFISTVQTRDTQPVRDYSAAKQQVESIKKHIRDLYILSWSHLIQLPESVQQDIVSVSDVLIVKLVNRLLQKVDVYELIDDLVVGVHTHLDRYHMTAKHQSNDLNSCQTEEGVSCDAVQSSIQIILAQYKQDWRAVHGSITRHQYLKFITGRLLSALVTTKPSPSAFEALTEIIAKNVLMNLISFLAKQEHLLKILIFVFATDVKKTLQRAQAVSRDDLRIIAPVTSPTDLPVLDQYGACVIGHEGNSHTRDHPSATLAEGQTTSLPDCHVTNPNGAFSAPSPAEEKTDHAQTEIFVSEDITRYLKVSALSPSDEQSKHTIPLTRLNASVKKHILSISVPSFETKMERSGMNSYILYCVSYTALNPDNSGSVISKLVFRRYREFVNLMARFERMGTYADFLDKIPTPSRWKQLFMDLTQKSELEKRRKHLEGFLQSLLKHPVLSSSDDFEEFLAYHGDAEIEFVKEVVHPAKRAILKFTDAIDQKLSNMFDKLPFPNISSSSELRGLKEHPESASHDAVGVGSLDGRLDVVIDSHERLQADCNITLVERNPVTKEPPLSYHSCLQEQGTICQKLSDSIFELLLESLQPHFILTRKAAVIQLLRSFATPCLVWWLQQKIDLYTSPSKVESILIMIQDVLWPEVHEPDVKYDIVLLKQVAIETVIADLPNVVTHFFSSRIELILREIVDITEDTKLNEAFLFALLELFISRSLKRLV